MSQSRSSLINTTLSLMIVDPTAMPPNLGHTQKEDYPESLFRVVAYDGKNILPTALGYRSHFSDQTTFQLPIAPSTHVQAMLIYQGVDYAVHIICLGEEGAWIINATDGQVEAVWDGIFGSDNDPDDQIRHQWSWAVVANQLYIYQQGQPEFYCICTPDYYDNNIGQTLIPNAGVYGVKRNGSYGILRIIPSFINMAGQVGLFRADTRLGFWDSVNSVSWSSATQVYDFKPQVTTFAGNTKFADVVGKITKVIGQGDGFIIYAARSIVRVVENVGSQELWAGTALLSDAGVAFDTQACASQPDDTHYALTGSGLYQITGGQVEPIEVEVSDYLMENSLVYAADVIDARYLFLHSDKDLIPSHYEVTTKVLDMEGNLYEFKPSIDESTLTNSADLTKSALEGTSATTKGDFTYSAEPIKQNGAPIVNAAGQATIPCYTGDGLSSNFDSSVLPSGSSDSLTTIPYSIDSTIKDGDTYEVNVKIAKPRFTNYIYNTDQHFIDKAAEDFQTEVQKTFTKITEMLSIASDGVALFTSGTEYQRLTDHFEEDDITEAIGFTKTTIIESDPIISWDWNNVFSGAQGNLTKSSCGYNLDGKLQNIKFKAKVTMVERVAPYYNVTQVNKIDLAEASISYISAIPEISTIIPTPNMDGCKFAFVSNPPDGSRGGIIGCTPRSAEVLSAMYNRTVTMGECMSVDQPFHSYPGQYYNPPTSTVVPTTPSTEIITWGIGIHQALGGSLVPSAAIETTEIPTTNECGSDTTIEGPNWALIDSLVGTIFQGKLSDTSVVQTGKLVDGVCQPNAQISSSTQKVIGQLSPWNVTTLLGDSISINDSDVVAALNLGRKILRLESLQVELIPEYEQQSDAIPIFESEISGYGYQPSGGYSFRKTHNRSSSSPCNGGGGPVTVPNNPAAPNNPADVPIDTRITKPPVPSKWNYPQPISRPPVSALFQVGTPAPFYPSYHSAIVYDLHLKKWGRYSNEHQVIFGTLPTNRVDHTVVPVVDKGIRGGAYAISTRKLSYFTPDNSNAMIAYGKIGKHRQGVSQSTMIVAHFAKPATGNIIIELSRDGITVDEESSLFIPVNNVLSVTFPFTETAKWFNIRIEGQFDLTYLEFESAATGRR